MHLLAKIVLYLILVVGNYVLLIVAVRIQASGGVLDPRVPCPCAGAVYCIGTKCVYVFIGTFFDIVKTFILNVSKNNSKTQFLSLHLRIPHCLYFREWEEDETVNRLVVNSH